MNTLFESLSDLYTKQRELAAIWLETPVTTNNGRTVRITEGMLLTIVDNKIADYSEPTHKIVLCLGTLVNQFQLVLINIHTNEPLTIAI